MRQALLVQAEHHHPQARAQVIALEQAGEGGDRRLRAHRIAALALHAQCVGQRLQAFVHQLQRMQELVVEKLGGLLPGEMDLQLVLGHQAQRFFMRLRRFRVEPAAERSEEHTSELQSLMRISYAVFCLKKKKKKNKYKNTYTHRT